MKRKVSRYLQSGFYVFAGVNHFINPTFYLPLIPPYFVYPELINGVAGFAEILLGLGLLSKKTRFAASYFIIVMLGVFIFSHVYFIQLGGCIGDGLCVPVWVGWVRLIVIHPLLMIWAWYNRK